MYYFFLTHFSCEKHNIKQRLAYIYFNQLKFEYVLIIKIYKIIMITSATDCWAISKTDARKIDALDQWCLCMLIGFKWYQFVRNDDVRRGNPNSLL